ncbi:PREDICTED: serine proteinase stubble-like isoform X2 [Trachymyrmex septentrionalis]|uniref:serine proteinase stubble-like isoform X2 n=1 Tax=Trachymyrmex septentrionalis TaxID=34720 RepID=UPI00084F24F3|nr:PREDICTED: serine proteinase stubble-like isoform X2 [Trachymyrmex septentrionalis]
MDTSRPRHWLLATVILSLSSSLMTSEIEQFTKYDSSVVNMRRDETNHTEGVVAIRRRRYVRFPTGSAYLLETGSTPHGRNFGPHPVTRFIPQTQFPGSWRQHKSFWRTPSDYNRPVMSHRTPRLIFRDNDFLPPVGGSATSFFQQSNQLPDFEDDIRDLRKQMPDDYPRLETGCGIPIVSKQIAQRRIVGGDEAGFGSFPWQAYIRIGSSRCGGTLVNRFHVVTAGHCVAKASARQVQVTLGDYVVNSATESLPAYTFGVREIRVHPYFKFTPQADRFDVAVLRLDRPVHYMPHIGPICLPEKNEDFLGQYGWAAGWGALQAGSRLRPKTLQAVDVPVIDNRLCERWHRSNGINVVIHDEMMCAGYRSGGKDSCQGDSGGPLMLEKTGRWYLIGIVSAGYSCAQPGQPGIYHRVAKTVDWITYVINS